MVLAETFTETSAIFQGCQKCCKFVLRSRIALGSDSVLPTNKLPKATQKLDFTNFKAEMKSNS